MSEYSFEVIEQYLTSPEFLNQQQDAIDFVLNHIAVIKQELSLEKNREVMDTISFRIKKAESIKKKLLYKQFPLTVESIKERLIDVTGVRIVCSFLDDVYDIADRIRQGEGFDIVDERDYIKKPKNSGYQSYHLIVKVPVQGGEKCKVEIQIRTVAMHYWAKLDHQLTYKMARTKEGDEIRKELRTYAQEIAEIEQKMLKIRKKIEIIRDREEKNNGV